MKLTNHIAYQFLTRNDIAKEITLALCPKDAEPTPEILGMFEATYYLVNTLHQRTYYITTTVFDKLDMLKVSRENNLLDWTVFMGKIKEGKTTYILPDNRVIRMRAYGNKLGFCIISANKVVDGIAHTEFSTFHVNRLDNELSSNWKTTPQIIENELLIYKLLCFLYLSENTEQVVAPGGKQGTRKSGKIINSLPFPIITVTSNWNIASIRTEGFDVSGHFRLQPTKAGTKMIFIEPFRKHGYTRTAKPQL